MMKRLTGKVFDLFLFILCFALFVTIIPEWICIVMVGIGLIVGLMILTGIDFFGRC